MSNVLVLNASYEALGTISWQRAMCLMFAGRCDLVERRPDGTVRTAGGDEYPFPSVVRLRQMVDAPRQRYVPVTRHGIKARDKGLCQNRACRSKGTTVNHIVPKSKGGEWSWANLAWMCAKCNSFKGDRSLAEAGMQLRRRPKAPSFEVMLASKAQPEWADWLPA